MKLRNLMYATMIACAFASCSKDDETNPDNGGQTGDATLEVNLNITSTKALGGLTGDETINDLTLIVFKSDNSVEAVVTRDGDTNKGNGAVSVKTVVTGGSKKVVVLANAKAALSGFTKGKTLSDLQAIKNTLSSESVTNLSMNSALFPVDLTPGVVNYLGYGALPGTAGSADKNLNSQVSGVTNVNTIGNGIILYRNVARISLNKITFNVDAVQYPGAKFEMTDVYVLHAKQQTNIFSEKEWGATEVAGSNYFNGVANTEYKGYVDLMQAYLNMADNKFEKIFNYLTDDSKYAPINNGLVLAEVKSHDFFDGNIFTNQDGSALSTFYVYENTNTTADTVAISTLLVVKGKFSFGNIKDEVRYYSMAIGRTTKGAAMSVPAPFKDLTHGRSIAAGRPDVLRNLQYNIDLTITGMGYTTPFGPKDPEGPNNAVLDVQCQVAQWGVVNQTPEI